MRGGAQIVCGEIRKKKTRQNGVSKIFVVFLAAPWRLGTEETDWMDDGGGVVVGELWCSTRGLMRVCVCVECAAGTVAYCWCGCCPAPARCCPGTFYNIHNKFWSSEVRAGIWYCAGGTQGKEEAAREICVARDVTHFLQLQTNKNFQACNVFFFLAWNHWGKNSMRKIVTFCIIFL